MLVVIRVFCYSLYFCSVSVTYIALSFYIYWIGLNVPNVPALLSISGRLAVNCVSASAGSYPGVNTVGIQ